MYTTLTPWIRGILESINYIITALLLSLKIGNEYRIFYVLLCMERSKRKAGIQLKCIPEKGIQLTQESFAKYFV